MFAEGVAGRDDLDNSDAQGNTAQQFHLRLKETRDYQLPEGKYYLYRENYAQALEQHLSQLHREGHLSSTVVYFGTTADPFLSLHKKFDVTLSCLDLLEQYRPGFVVIQTRSPMVITALPMLKSLQDRSVVVVPIESHLESSIARYTPGQPRVAERLVAVDGLRKQGVKVDLSVSPVLPYGDFYRDAWDFAELLARRADYVTFGCLASPDAGSELQLKNKPIAQKLIADNNYKWLRPYSFRYVYYAMRVIAPEKLLLPARLVGGSNQLKLFAA
jgi:DNA repair photolyase